VNRPTLPSDRRRPRPEPVRRLLYAVAFVVVFVLGAGTGRWLGDGTAGATSSLQDAPAFGVLAETWNLIQNEWAVPEEVDEQELLYGAAAGMIDALGDDGHSRFLDPEDARLFEEATRGEFTGVGVEIDFRDARPTVIAPIDGSPADEAGIRPRDAIVEIDGVETDRLSQEEIGDRIRGDAGTEVTLTLLRPGVDSPYSVTLTRRTITLDPVSWRMLPGNVAQVRLAEFSVGATQDLRDALDAARAAGAAGIVLDLRNNPGGLVSEAIGVASQFLPEGTTIFQQQERDQDPYPVNTVGTDGRWLAGPLAVLTNENSASAAEIVAGALRDNGRARLIGETTFGTGTVLLPFEQPDGSTVLLGTALWLTADGEQIWKEGVEPDQEVGLPLTAFPSRPNDDQEVTPAEFAQLEDAQLREAVAFAAGELPPPPQLTEAAP